MLRLLLAALATAWCFSASAQNNFPAPGGQNVPLAVQGCINASGQAVPCGSAGATQTAQIVLGTAVANSVAGSTGIITTTLPASVSGKSTYLCHYDTSSAGGTAQTGPITITGLLGGTQTFQIPANVATGNLPFQLNFNPCWPSSAVNTAIVATTTADGTASATDANMLGYQN